MLVVTSNLPVVTGDLAEWSLEVEFDQVLARLVGLSDRRGLPRWPPAPARPPGWMPPSAASPTDRTGRSCRKATAFRRVDQTLVRQSNFAIFAKICYDAIVAIDDSVLAGRVRDALRHAGITQVDLARAVGMDNTAVSKCLNGKRKLSSLELAKIADALGVAVSTLLADDAGRMSFSGRVDVARTPATAATEFLETLIDLDELLADLGFPGAAKEHGFPLPPAGGTEVDQAGALARGVEELLGSSRGPFTSGVVQLARAAEARLGVDVALRPFREGFDGLSVARGPFRLVVVNSATPRTRQLFTLAHEIGHLAAGDANERITFDAAGSIVIDEDVYGRRTPEERRANSFAGAVLMPDRTLHARVGGGKVDEEIIVRLLTEFGVSFDALVYRLHNVGLINAGTRDRLRSSPVRRSGIRIGQSSSSHATRAPGNLLRRALDAYDAGRLSARVLADLTETDLDEMLRQLEPPDARENDLVDGDDILGVL